VVAARSNVLLCLKRLHFAGGLEKLELVVDALHSPHALNRVDDIVELIAQCDAAKCDSMIVGEHLDSFSMLDFVIELCTNSRREQVICLRRFLSPCLCALSRSRTSFTQE
jgi:hypothetical protein